MRRTRTHNRLEPRCRERDARGFTLVELMVVVVIISIASAITIPAMIGGRNEARSYGNAALVAGMLRDARARSVARGAAVRVSMTTNADTDRGTFTMEERVAPAGGPQAGMPVAQCTGANGTWNALGTVSFNGGVDVQIGTLTTLFSPTNASVAAAQACFTPLGRTFFASGSDLGTLALAPLAGAFGVRVVISGSATATDPAAAIAAGAMPRTVVVPSTGAARVRSL